MRIKVETDENGYAIGKCPMLGDVIAGGPVCNLLCKYRGASSFSDRTFECARNYWPEFAHTDITKLAKSTALWQYKEDDKAGVIFNGLVLKECEPEPQSKLEGNWLYGKWVKDGKQVKIHIDNLNPLRYHTEDGSPLTLESLSVKGEYLECVVNGEKCVLKRE